MLCVRAGGQERCAFDAIVDNEDLHLVSSFDSICSRVKTPRVKKAGGSDGKGTRVRLDEIASPLRFEGLTKWVALPNGVAVFLRFRTHFSKIDQFVQTHSA